MTNSLKKTFYAWYRLFRLPNLFTVPGDPVFGFFAAGGSQNDPRLVYVALISLVLYLYGLVTNDIVDFEEDSRERPQRPLPTGDIKMSSVKLVAIILVVVSLSLAFYVGCWTLLVSMALLGMISLYNFVFKEDKIFGPLLLGLCRAASIFIGVSVIFPVSRVAYPFLITSGAAVSFLYIFGVSCIAQAETRTMDKIRGRGVLIFALVIWVIAGGVLIYRQYSLNEKLTTLTMIVAALVLIVWAVGSLMHCRALIPGTAPEDVQKHVGGMIRLLLLFQAAGCAISGSMILSLVLAFMILPATLASKKFYGS